MLNKEGKLVLPKSFDFSKLKAIGGHEVDVYEKEEYCSSFGSMSVFLLKYGRKTIYVPSMTLGMLKEISPEIFELFKEWCPFRLYSDDIDTSLEFDVVYHKYRKELLPNYEFKKTDKPIYNIFNLKNHSSKKGYYIAYGFNQIEDVSYLSEGLYKNGELISPSIITFSNYHYAIYKEENTHIIVDMHTNEEIRTNQFDEIVEITDSYIVGVNEKEDYREEFYYYYKVVRKSDGQVIYKDTDGHYNNGTGYSGNYTLIGDRYLTIYSFSKGVLDLKTGERIEYPFANTCENFICNITKTEFTDKNGTHDLNKLPDLSWTGYDTLKFLKKFQGFIPNKNQVGFRSLIYTGGYETHRNDILSFKGMTKGVFYKRRNELVNLIDNSSFKIDDVMLNWIKKSEFVYIFDRKPRDIKRFSILKPLKEGMIIQDLYFEYGYLYRRGGGKDNLKTNFLRNEVSFKTSNIKDIILNVNETNPIIEIECEIGDKKITFETTNCVKFEVASLV